MAKLTQLEKIKFGDLFDMTGGYVMNFTNMSFAGLFKDTANIWTSMI